MNLTTDEATCPSLVRGTDMTLRLQRLVAGWRGAERGQLLTALHDECRNAVGPGGWHLLPVRLLLVKDLDTTTLQAVLCTLNGGGYNRPLQFRVAPAGHFDSALVPTGPAGAPGSAWLLTVEAGLAVREQVALYAHAIGHLLLNRESQQMGQLPPLDPRDGFAHADSLAELRLLESMRRPLDRRVLEAYPGLAELLRMRVEPFAAVEQTLTELRQRLGQAVWPQHLIEASYVFTAGRVYVSGTAVRPWAAAACRCLAALPDVVADRPGADAAAWGNLPGRGATPVRHLSGHCLGRASGGTVPQLPTRLFRPGHCR